MANLKNRVAIVTGGSKGIGFAVATMLVEGGAEVALAARGAADLESAARRLGETSGRTLLALPTDVADQAQCERMIAATVEHFGRLDILVNNAGVGVFAPVGELTAEAWTRQIGTNLSGAFFCSTAALPHLRASQGWIINVASLAAVNPFAGGAAYNASKFGLLGFSEALMLDVRHQGVRVSCVMPGSVATDFAASGQHDESWKLRPDDVAEVVRDLLAFPPRALPSRVEIRPSRPPRK
jgi:3-oxoacyl-[acyl-carrier protein] reductase